MNCELTGVTALHDM